ncbi:ATP-dependent nuclease [Sphingobacterium sp. NPDC055431]
MYLSALHITNFRKIENLDLTFNRGINLLVGENDAGKSSIIDAIRLITGIHGNDYLRVSHDDFHHNGLSRSTHLQIACEFRNLSSEESACFLEWLSIEGEEYYLKLTLSAYRKDRGNSSFEVFYDIRAGEDEESGVIGGEARSRLKATYLKPLRDAGHELAPRRGSRLSQILGAYDIFNQKPDVVHPLVETMNKANDDITEYFEKKEGKVVSDTINVTYLKEISLKNNPLQSRFGIVRNELGRILEKLELVGVSSIDETNIGLGSNNLLFIAAEMLLLKKDSGYVGLKLALIEEIEAHIHPQSQINLIDFLNKHCSKLQFQNIISTHSNSLASKIDLNNLIICKSGHAFSLDSSFTLLEKSDYAFLGRFLDDTKSNLFFAHGVLMVEGDAENLIIPSFASKIGLALHKYGISIVNVGNLALMRYSRIFRRKDGVSMGIKVACITDRDIPPAEAASYCYEIKRRKTGTLETEYLLSSSRKTEADYTHTEIEELIQKKKEKYSGGDVKVFIGTTWTLEFEIAKSILKHLLHRAIQIALKTCNMEKDLDFDGYRLVAKDAETQLNSWISQGKTATQIALEIYVPLERKQVSKAVVAQIFARLLKIERIKASDIVADTSLKYLVDAIKHAANV